MTKKKLIFWIPLAALLVNGLIYFIVSSARTQDQAASTALASRPADPQAPPLTQERREVARAKELVAGDQPQDRQQQQGQKERDDEKTALARRAIGLAALEAGDYEKALINFTEARALLGDKAQVGDLLNVTEELRGRPPSAIHRFSKAAPPPPAPAAPAPIAQRPQTRAAAPVRRVAFREAPPAPAAESSPPEAPASGLLIVTTTPRGLLVQVDEAPLDLTPMRAKVSPGSHRIALLDGDRKVYDAAFVVKEGATATVLKDLSAEIAASMRPTTPPPAPASAPTSPALAKEEAPSRSAVVPASSTEPAPAVRSRARSSLPRLGTGALAISSPGLYGVVWVNGRPRGYPPVEISDMPVGPTKIEVRVNGVEKRSSTVVVQPGITTSVSLRTPETAP